MSTPGSPRKNPIHAVSDGGVGVTVVLPSCQTVTASAMDHPDLFWALRGGGGGNCGITTSFTCRTFPTVTRDVVSLAFPYASAGAGTAVVESPTGAVGDIAPGDSAFPWRRQAAVIQWYTEAPVDTANAWLIRAHQAVQANSVGGYVNYVEPETVAGRYFGDNLARLNSIRQLYHPSGLIYSGLATA